MSERHLIFVTPVLPWPMDQGSKWFLLDTARSLRQFGAVHWVTRELGDQHAARSWLTEEGFDLNLDQSFVARSFWRRAARRLSNDLRAMSWRLPREASFTCSRGVLAIVRRLARQHPDAVVVGAFWNTFRALEALPVHRRALILSDVESARELAACSVGAGSRRRARALERAELRALRSVAHVYCLSTEDVQLAKRLSPGSDVQLWPLRLPDAVQKDLATRPVDSPFRTLLIYGHWSAPFNLDGLNWFLECIWPAIRSSLGPAVRVRLAGGGLPHSTASRAAAGGLEVLGYVEDVATELANCDAVAIPLRYAGGVRYRFLEALAAGAPCLASSAAARGTGAEADSHFLQCDSPEAWAHAVSELNDSAKVEQMRRRGQNFIVERFGEAAHGRRLSEAMTPLLKSWGRVDA